MSYALYNYFTIPLLQLIGKRKNQENSQIPSPKDQLSIYLNPFLEQVQQKNFKYLYYIILKDPPNPVSAKFHVGWWV